METSKLYPSYTICVTQALSSSPHPLTIDDLLAQVERQRPLGKGARDAIYRAVRELYQAVPVASSQIGWLSHLLQGSSFRHPLTAAESRRGFLLLDELEHAVFFPQFFQRQKTELRQVVVELMGGQTLHAEAAVERNQWTLRLGLPFAEWIDAQGGQSQDDILILVEDAVKGHYRFRLQPHESRDEGAIHQQNQQLALAAETLMSHFRRTDKVIPVWELAALLVGRELYHSPIPPDELHSVLHEYSALRLTDDGAGYFLDRQVPAKDEPVAQKKNKAYQPPSLGNKKPGLPSSRPGFFADSTGKNVPPDDDDDGELCDDYAAYLEAFRLSELPGPPLLHGEYHLLEAELELLLALEDEFGQLLPEQNDRMESLANRLLIDLDSLEFDDDEEDGGDDGFVFWKN